MTNQAQTLQDRLKEYEVYYETRVSATAVSTANILTETITALDEKDAEIARLREALGLIASCRNQFPGDVTDVAREALNTQRQK